MGIKQDMPSRGVAADRLHDYVRLWADTKPQADAAIEPGRRLDWAALAAAVDDCAAALVAQGVAHGDRVATLAPPGLDFLVSFLATVSVGAIWVGLNPRYADPELDAVLARIEPKLVLVTPQIEARDYRGWAAALPAKVIVVAFTSDGAEPGRLRSLQAFLASGASVEPARLRRRCREVLPADPCLIVFTSGSTGTPKGAVISHAALVGASKVQLREWPAEPLRVLDNLPINHIGCVGDLGCYALVGGGTLVFTPRFDPEASLVAIRDERITVWGQVPTMFQLTLDAPGFEPGMLASLQRVFWGGAHASSDLLQRLAQVAPRLATSWGQTETVGSVTFTTPDDGLPALSETVGRVVPPYALRIVDSDGNPLEPGGEGEIQVHTPFGMSGYWRDSAATAAVMAKDGWQRTGDVGMLTPNGRLRLLGRVHDVFKSGGYNIHPPEIEAAIESHPAIAQAAVVGVADALYGKVAVAFATCTAAPPSPDALRAHLRERLANYKVPKRIVFLDELPRLPVGKVDKQALREQAESA